MEVVDEAEGGLAGYGEVLGGLVAVVGEFVELAAVLGAEAEVGTEKVIDAEAAYAEGAIVGGGAAGIEGVLIGGMERWVGTKSIMPAPTSAKPESFAVMGF